MKRLLLCLLLSVAAARGEPVLVPVLTGAWTPVDQNASVQKLLKEQDRSWHFTPEEAVKAADPVTIKIGALSHCYYSGSKPLTTTLKGMPFARLVGAVYARTSPDGKTWSKAQAVAWGGQSGEDLASAGHPSIVELQPGLFYLFRTQTTKDRSVTHIYRSSDPLDFGLYGNNADALHYVTSLPAVIKAVVQHEGEWFAVQNGKMARLAWRDLPTPSLPVTRAPGITIRVALYDDSGSAGKGIPMVSEQLAKCKDIEVTKLNREGIRAGLNGYDVVIFTGGSSARQANTIGLVGREQVRRFVAAGGGYVGICAGAYLACDGFSWGIKVLDARTPSPKWERGIAELKIETIEEGQKLMGLPKETLVKYHNGPLLVPAGNSSIPDFKPLTYFRTEVAKNGSTPGIMINSPAIARGKFGAGCVLACSPHPEQSVGLEGWIENAVRTVAAQ
ncbi:MAG: BPL-N domain-containing protein [Prosthecobacter sp.]